MAGKRDIKKTAFIIGLAATVIWGIANILAIKAHKTRIEYYSKASKNE